MLHIRISQLPPASALLAGATLGDAHSSEIDCLAKAENKPAVSVLLDFEGIESITASYLKTLLRVFDPAPEGPQIYPLAANVGSADLRYELDSFLNEKDRVIQEVTSELGSISPAALLGRLETSSADAYRELGAVGSTTAATLHVRNPQAASSQTAWNNRLTKLYELRLAHRERVGRNWIYRPVVNI